MTARTMTLEESLAPGVLLREARVEGGVLANVTLLGAVSANNRRYTDQALKEAADQMKGTKFFLDHPKKSDLAERKGTRSVRDLAGRVVSARKVGSKVRGDVQLLDVEPSRSLITSLAEQMPEVVGASQRARGKVRLDDEGVQVVEHIEEIRSVDLVVDPATTDGLFESVCRDCREESDRSGRLLSEAEVERAYFDMFV